MSQMKSRAELTLVHIQDYLPQIVDRLASFEGVVDRQGSAIGLEYPFGTASLDFGGKSFSMEVTATDVDGLQRVRELVTVAVQIYAKQEQPEIVWQGDLAGDRALATFRKMRVLKAERITPRMIRVRLEGDNLGRYAEFGGMHLRLLFPTAQNPDPVWPVAGPNGQPQWPDESRRPVARVYTIRKLNVSAGWMDIDFVVHEHDGEGVGSAWAMNAKAGAEIGIIGPVGRPVRTADWYVLGCDETGLPAVSRLLEEMSPGTRGVAFIEVADEAERQAIRHPEGFRVNWIYRNGVEPGLHPDLVDAVSNVQWPSDVSCFGWFAAEAEPARILRNHWRVNLSYGRDQTLVAGYWRRGVSGVMAG